MWYCGLHPSEQGDKLSRPASSSAHELHPSLCSHCTYYVNSQLLNQPRSYFIIIAVTRKNRQILHTPNKRHLRYIKLFNIIILTMPVKFTKIKTSFYYPVTTRHPNYQAICEEPLKFFSSLLQEFIDSVPEVWEYSQMATREYPQTVNRD